MRVVCEITGCGKPAVAKGLCDMHRRRYARHGDVNAARPEGWGKGHGDPLYERWRSMRRSARLSGGCVPEWDDFQTFRRDVGPIPGPTYRMYRLDETQPFGPSNVTWRERVTDKPSGQTREERNAYMRDYERARPHVRKAHYLKKHYGVTLEWYEAQTEAQGGLCAICGCLESRPHNRTKEPRLLAVDHDHATGAVRGLLCSACNQALGLLEDSQDRLRSAIAYLRRHAPKS